MADVPSNLIPTRITQLPVAPVADENSLMMIVYQGNNYQIRVGDLLSVAGVPTSRQVIAGTGLQGGGQLSSNVTLSVAPGGIGTTQLANSGVSPGVYGDATNIPVFTVDTTGRVTAATTIPASVSGFVPDSRQVIAGAGLTGGGSLNTNVTLDANLSNSAPEPGFQFGSAGVSSGISRSDHKHPAVNLGVDNEVDGVLGLGNGGTARSIVPDEGAIVWCGADGLYVGPVGTAGQVLQSTGVGEYIWVNQSTLNVGRATNLNGGAANRIPYQTAANATGFIGAPVAADTFLKWDGAQLVWGALPGGGTVTSVNASGGTTGLTFTGGPVTASGTLTLGGTLLTTNGGTGLSAFSAGDTLYYTSGDALSKLSIGASSFIMTSSGSAPQWTNPSTITVGSATTATSATSATTATTATNVAGGAANRILYNTGAGATSFVTAPITSSTYLKWDGAAFVWDTAGTGTVTSVGMTVPTGLSVSGTPVTGSGTLSVTFQAGYSIPTTASQSNWDTAYTDRLKWDGGATGLNAGTGRTSLGGTTVGQNLFTLTNPSAVTFPRFNADNTVSALDAATFRTAIGAGTGNGTVTSIVAGSFLTGGTITTTGTIAVDATSANTASKVVARDASGNFSAGTITAALSGNATTATNLAGGAASQIPYQTGSGATTFLANGTSGQVLRSNGASAPSWAGVDGGTF